MKPIVIAVEGVGSMSSEEVCASILDLDRWREFEGHGFLPGIERAVFEVRTPEVVGTRIRVFSKDGSEHVEEIVEWDTQRRIAMKFQDFQSPVRRLATGFLESWTFSPGTEGLRMRREMAMYPKGIFGWLMLRMISRMMRQAFLKQAVTMGIREVH